MKRILGTFMTVFVVIFLASPTLADEQLEEQLVVENINEDINEAQAEDESTQTNTSITKQDNQITLEVSTGENTIENSNFIDTFSTGDIAGDVNSVKAYNSSLKEGSQIGTKSSLNDDQVDFHDFVQMDSSIDIGSSGAYPTNNFLILEEQDRLDINLNTGDNDFNRNTIINQVETGDITFAANLVDVNNLTAPELLLNINIYSILSDFIGDIILEDEFVNGTDPIMSIMDSPQINVSNQENISHTADFEMITGENTFSRNSLVGNVESGDASAGYFENSFAGVISDVNFFILNVLGDWIGINEYAERENVIVNVLGGSYYPDSMSAFYCPDEENQSLIDQDTTISATANTGRNSFMENTLIGGLATGKINLLESIIAVKPNLISLKNRLNIRVVNILGNFFGNIKKASAEEPIDCNKDNTCPVVSPTPSPTIEPTQPPAEQPEPEKNEVLGIQEEITSTPLPPQSIQAISLNPGNIEVGSNITQLLPLLLIIPTGLILRKLKKA